MNKRNATYAVGGAIVGAYLMYNYLYRQIAKIALNTGKELAEDRKSKREVSYRKFAE